MEPTLRRFFLHPLQKLRPRSVKRAARGMLAGMHAAKPRPGHAPRRPKHVALPAMQPKHTKHTKRGIPPAMEQGTQRRRASAPMDVDDRLLVPHILRVQEKNPLTAA